HGFPAPTIEDFERLYGPVGACPRVLFGDPAAARAFRESHPDIAIAAVTDDRTRAGDPLTISYADITVLGMFVTGGDWPPRGR
ncbi:MAG TPA: hypothetical protein VJB16_01055, partial [archaeon]|nr:hypothetical protein [archaeon]